MKKEKTLKEKIEFFERLYREGKISKKDLEDLIAGEKALERFKTKES